MRHDLTLVDGPYTLRPLHEADIAPLLALVIVTGLRFWPVSRLAAALMAPYAAWVAYATYLNAGIFVLNG